MSDDCTAKVTAENAWIAQLPVADRVAILNTYDLNAAAQLTDDQRLRLYFDQTIWNPHAININAPHHVNMPGTLNLYVPKDPQGLNHYYEDSRLC